MTNKKDQRKKKQLRIRSKISGTGEIPRVSIFKSNKNIYVQLIDDKKGKTLTSSSTKLIGLDGKKSVSAAKKLGKDFGEKISKLGIKKIIFDRSGYLYHGKVAAIADALRSEGLEF